MAKPEVDSLCVVPWIGVEAAPDGTCRPCCVSTHIIKNEGSPVSLIESTLSSAYHSEDMQELRRQFRRGEKPESCTRCWQEEAAGRNSKRINTKIRLQHLLDDVDWDNDNPDQLWFLDLKLGNICNLKCLICGSWSSSKWAREEIDYVPEPYRKNHVAHKQIQLGQWPRKNAQFWDDLESLLSQIRYIEFTGGEPFLIDQHFDFLETAVATGHSQHIAIHYNTNGTVFPDRHHLWSKFEHVEVAFSIDDVGDRFEYQRYGASWPEVCANIQRVSALKSRSLSTQLCLTVNAQNVYYLPEIVEWVNKQQFDFVFFNMLHDPNYMSIARLTDASKQLVATRLQRHDFEKYNDEIARIILFMQQGESSSGVDFCQRMYRADSYRNTDFSAAHSEIARTQGYAKTRKTS